MIPGDPVLAGPRPSGFGLDIAGIRVTVTSEDPAIGLIPTGTAAKFATSTEAADLDIHVGWGSPSPGAAADLLFDSGGGLWRLYNERGCHRFVLTSPVLGPAPYQDATFDPSYRHAHVRLRRDVFLPRVPLYPLEYPLDELLMVHLLSQGRGIEIHASGIVTGDGRGLLFAGQSGAGKTTMANLWRGQPGVTILSDERVILRSEGGVIWMYGTPWHGEGRLASPGRVPLAQIFLLRHAPENRVMPIAPGTAVARIFACSFTPFHDAAGLEFSLRLLSEIVAHCPCVEFGFRPDDDAIDFVLQSLPG